jgi:hypothetical protein
MDRVSRGAVPGERFAQLLHRSRRGEMVRDGHVHDAPALMGEDHEEVRSHHLSDVICQERTPCLRLGSTATVAKYMGRSRQPPCGSTDVSADGWSLDHRRTPRLANKKLGPIPTQPLTVDDGATCDAPAFSLRLLFSPPRNNLPV